MGQQGATTIEQTGIGLHLGQTTQVRLILDSASKQRYFVRVDLPGQPHIPATLAHVGPTMLSTELGQGDAKIRTVEHLLAALSTNQLHGVRIEVDGPEIPLLDGSALGWVEAIATAGLVQSGSPWPEPWLLTQPITVFDGDAFVTAIPAPRLQFTYGVDYLYTAIGQQWHSWQPAQESFAQTIAPARTFGFADQIEQLRQQGLIKGGSLDNALVCDHQGWLNPPLRFANEPVRHKLLDLVGDLSLLGNLPCAHILAYKASHRLHIQFAQALASLQPQ
ncbi:MAG: UDP-3-O-acyl-N-acetylglucosamine deacetylase [Spirulina sp. SIO3F2]|nr:UDP-3-O-acyl-N-acetylglucosamine deacetylase [Spirulina sp. SIO3F2]